MNELEDLYREIILDHYRNPRNFGHLERVDAAAEDLNPLCGDKIRFERPSPFGVVKWEKSKADLTDEERRLVDSQLNSQSASQKAKQD